MSQSRPWKQIAWHCLVGVFWLLFVWVGFMVFVLGRFFAFSFFGGEWWQEARKDLKWVNILESKVIIVFHMVLLCPVLQRAVIWALQIWFQLLLHQIFLLLTASRPATITNCLKKPPNTSMLPGASHSNFSEELMPQKLILKGKMTSSGQEEGRLYLTPSPRFYIIHLHIISPTVFSHRTG